MKTTAGGKKIRFHNGNGDGNPQPGSHGHPPINPIQTLDSDGEMKNPLRCKGFWMNASH
jgi:hypothetical protein